MKLIALGLFVALPVLSSPMPLTHVGASSVAFDQCTSCTGTAHTPYNNSPCISVTWDPAQSITSGSCAPPPSVKGRATGTTSRSGKRDHLFDLLAGATA
ncbi:MAG: hypothetical protein WAT39_12660 [Planctomycetota bacterium]